MLNENKDLQQGKLQHLAQLRYKNDSYLIFLLNGKKLKVEYAVGFTNIFGRYMLMQSAIANQQQPINTSQSTVANRQ